MRICSSSLIFLATVLMLFYTMSSLIPVVLGGFWKVIYKSLLKVLNLTEIPISRCDLRFLWNQPQKIYGQRPAKNHVHFGFFLLIFTNFLHILSIFVYCLILVVEAFLFFITKWIFLYVINKIISNIQFHIISQILLFLKFFFS